MRLPTLVAATLLASCAGAPMGHHHGHESHANHGNPDDFEGYVRRMDDPERDAWQKPDEVLAKLALKAGDTLCDIGPGPGYFTLRAAKAVGPTGRVWAVDVEPRMLGVLRDRLGSQGISNVLPVLGLPADPLLPDATCDVVLIVDTYHHFGDGPAMLRRLTRALKPGGRLVNIDFQAGDLPIGPPPEMRISRDAFVAEAARAGLRVTAEHTILPYQYFLELSP